jgi:hypothetical protein
MHLAEIVPWGRSFEEYQAMFGLTGADLGRRILGCGDGPAAFNAEATARGAEVISVDPLYAFDVDAIRTRIDTVRPQIEAGLRAAPERYVWTHFRDVDHLVTARMAAMRDFLADYAGPGAPSRYVAASLPSLPFPDACFDLALVSHLLFTYSDHLGADAHRAGVLELMRVSRELRIFPLLTLAGEPSPHVPVILEAARQQGWSTEEVAVDYAFQRGGDRMLRLQAPDRPGIES